MDATVTAGPRILERSQHAVSRRNIDGQAVKVLYRLHHAGFKAYLVGGGVRDLMLERQPKDFDVSTDARPQQIRKLFRNSRIIGRRFRLAHVYFKGGIVEVSTFRRDPDPEAQASAPDELLITDDNVYGTPEEDAFRRDFTINALFYNVADFSVIDYVGGVDDLEQKLIRAIGDPEVRFQEDPVRMLRACELAGRLEFGIEPATRAALERHRREVRKAAPARLTEEVIELLRCGRSGPALRWMERTELLAEFLPEGATLLAAGERGAPELERMLPALDRLVGEGRTPSDAALLASLLLPGVLLGRREREQRSGRPLTRTALGRLLEETLAPFLERLRISRARSEQMQRALAVFLDLGEPWKSDGHKLRFATRPGFDDALTLLELLVEATGEGQEALEDWRRVQQRRPAVAAREPRTRRRPRRRRRRRRRR